MYRFQCFCRFLKCILEIVFCEGVQLRLRLCLDHLNCVKMAVVQFYLQSEKQKSTVCVRDDTRVIFGQEFPGEKEV
jgi:hypothetical protein